MSKQTLAALHDAVAAHIKDEGEGDYLTEWVLSAAAVVPNTPRATSYYYYDNDLPAHHAVGLLQKATDFVTDYVEADDDA